MSPSSPDQPAGGGNQATHPADLALAHLGSTASHQPAPSARAKGSGRGPIRRAYSSDLSIDEAILLAETGYEPQGLITGSSIYHIGMVSSWNMNQNGELTQLSSAMYDARRRAIERLVSSGRKVGGEGVIGVRLDIEMFEGRSHLAEFHAMGTAISGPPRPAADRGKPVPPFFTSDLSGQDFYLLHRAGYRPLGLVMGSCVYYVARQAMGTWAGNRAQNVEIATFTSALYDARELAMTRMQDEARHLGASGIVGVTIEEKSHVWGSHVIEFFAIGTAVKLFEDSHRHLNPKAVVPLTDPPDNQYQ